MKQADTLRRAGDKDVKAVAELALLLWPEHTQAELEEELDVFLEVYNGLARSYNKALGRPVVRQLARLRGWQSWPALDFCPGR